MQQYLGAALCAAPDKRELKQDLLVSELPTSRELIGLVNTSAFPSTDLVKSPTSRLLARPVRRASTSGLPVVRNEQFGFGFLVVQSEMESGRSLFANI